MAGLLLSPVLLTCVSPCRVVVERFILCGDYSQGVARIQCTRCKKSLDRLDGWQTRGLAYPAQIIGFPITSFMTAGAYPAAVLEAVAERVKGWFPRFELRAG